jgi:transposase
MVGEGKRVAELEAENAELRELAEQLGEQVDQLTAKIAELEARLATTSKTSSKPPSSDPNTARAEAKQSRAERRAAARQQGKARKPGKQPGAEGYHLAQVDSPTTTVVHVPKRCSACEAELADAERVGDERRQVFDLPAVAVEVTEHVAERRRCSCGCVTAAPFPPEAIGAACFGSGVRALGVYLTHRQHIPMERAAEMMADVLGVPVSTGFLAGLGPEAAGRLNGFLAHLTDRLARSPVVHADETSIRVTSESSVAWWLHVVATTTLTWLGVHPRRGRDAISHFDILPGYAGVVVHDGLAAYDYLERALHAQCNAHLIRHLAAALSHDDTKLWARLMTKALLDGAEAARHAREAGHAKVGRAGLAKIRKDYRWALDVAFRTLPEGPPPRLRNTGGWLPHQRDAWNLAVRMRDNQADILRFLVDTRVSFTNNNAERPLRPAKLHDKISGTFRGINHARAFATIRSYLDTAAKNNKNRYEALLELFSTGAWLPPEAAPT